MNDQTTTAMPDAAADANLIPDTPAPTETLLVPSTARLNLTPVDGIEVTALGLRVPDTKDITPSEFNSLLRCAISCSRASNWIIGDTLDLAERTWGNKATGSKYEEAARETGMSISTLKHIASICHNIPYENRRATLSFTHHLEAHNLTDSVSEREAALDRACEEHTSVKALRTELRQQRAEKLQASGEAVQGRDIVDELCSEEAQEAVAFPCSYELLKFNYWLQKQNLWKLDDDVRVRIIEAAAPLMTRLYTLMQLELEENPDAEFDVPFSIQPRDFDTNTPL